MPTDALALCLAKTSAAMILTMHDSLRQSDAIFLVGHHSSDNGISPVSVQLQGTAATLLTAPLGTNFSEI